jgi:UDP-glucuronate decarboxylase
LSIQYNTKMTNKAVKIVTEDVDAIIDDLGARTKAFDGASILVTGGLGFLGSYIIDTLARLNEGNLSNKCRIICMDNECVSDRSGVAHLANRKDIEFVKHDITKSFTLKGHVDYIFHAASIASPQFYQKYPLETIDVNVGGTRRILELARERRTSSVLLFSTSEIYGDPHDDQVPTSEEYVGRVSCVGPRACYDESKRLAETLSLVYFSRYEVPVNITRTFNVFGPRLKLSDGRVVSNFFRCALANQPLVVYDEVSTRSFCYISDNIRAQFLVLLSGLKGQIYNVGNNKEEITMRQLAERITPFFGDTLNIMNNVPKDHVYLIDNPKRRCPQISKIEKKLGWVPKYSLDQGLRRAYLWYKDELERAGSSLK